MLNIANICVHAMIFRGCNLDFRKSFKIFGKSPLLVFIYFRRAGAAVFHVRPTGDPSVYDGRQVVADTILDKD